MKVISTISIGLLLLTGCVAVDNVMGQDTKIVKVEDKVTLSDNSISSNSNLSIIFKTF